jgi:hypothetical protein
MTIDATADIDGLTLPELLTAAELAGRRLKEHLQYDLLAKAHAIASDPSSPHESLWQSRDFANRLVVRWQSYNDAIQQRIESILQNS